MQRHLYLADFLAIKDCLNEKLLDECIKSNEEQKRNPTQENTRLFALLMNELDDDFVKDGHMGLHFVDEITRLHHLVLVVDMMTDVYSLKTKFVVIPEELVLKMQNEVFEMKHELNSLTKKICNTIKNIQL